MLVLTAVPARCLTCLNSFWKVARGRLFHAMVSVMAVKIQLSSPSGVLRSVWRPGILRRVGWGSTVRATATVLGDPYNCASEYGRLAG